MYARVVLTSRAVPLYRLWVSAHSRASYPIDFRPYTFMGFVVATKSVSRPRAYSSPRALLPTSSKKECAQTVRSLMLRLVGMLSAQRFTTSSSRAELYQILDSSFKPSQSSSSVKRSND